MGRLFWKFFLSILLAQVAATVAIGGAVWLKSRTATVHAPADLDTSPPAELAITAATATLQYGGPAGLKAMLATMERHRVYAVDELGHELLGRITSPAMLAEARQLLKQRSARPVVAEVAAADSHRYLLFLPSHQHLGSFDADAQPLLPLASETLAGLRGFEATAGTARAPHRAPGDGRAPGDPDGTSLRDAPDGAGMRGGPDEAGMRDGPDGAGMRGGPDGPGGPGGPGGPPGPRFQPLTPWIPIVAAVLASLLFAVLLAWYFSRPIRALRAAFEAAADGDLAPRFGAAAAQRGNELHDLGRDFDRMTARLRNLIDGQVRLLHDVSHELRSPLARLQAAIGLAHQQPDKIAASLERIERESVRMDKLVGELLTLSRLEAGVQNAAQEDISMAELLQQITADAQYEAASQGRSVTLLSEADAMVRGQADLLARAIENVVRNAIKHSGDGGAIELELEPLPEAQQLRIRVLDRGPGVAGEELELIFQPFFRGSGAGAGGHGLGLAIARQVVQAHAGSIRALNRVNGGLCVEIALPMAARGA